MNKQLEELTFEEAFAELERVVSAMEKPGVDFQKNMEYYALAGRLVEQCQKRLAEAKGKITDIDTHIRSLTGSASAAIPD